MKSSTSALRRSTISMLAFLAATVLWAVILPGVASAVTFTVNRNDDIAPRGTGVTCIAAVSTDCTLREAVIKLNATAACAPPNAACIINFAGTTNGTPILLTITSTSNAADAATGDLDINANVEIQGNGPANTVIQGAFPDADNKDNKIFGINQDGTHDNLQVTIDNVTITGGRNSVLFNDPSFAWTGGGIDIFLTGTTAKTVLSNCVITDNTNVHGYGGGINISSLGPLANPNNGVLHGSVEITNCEISNNHELGTPNPSAATSRPIRHLWRRDLHRFLGQSQRDDHGQPDRRQQHPRIRRRHRHHHEPRHRRHPQLDDRGRPVAERGLHGLRQHGRAAGRRHQRQRPRRPDRDHRPGERHPEQRRGQQHRGPRGGLGRRHSERQQRELVDLAQQGHDHRQQRVSQCADPERRRWDPRRWQPDGELLPDRGQFRRTGGGNGLRVDNGGPGTVIATNNWWGCNDGPSAAPCDTAILDGSGAGSPPATLNFNPWLVLSLGVSPGSVVPNGTSALTADFLNKSDATTVTPVDITVLLGLPIAFGATHGAISGAQATVQTTGTATATFTHDATCLAGTANATVDTTPGPTVSVDPITVTCPDLTAAKTNNVGGSVSLSPGSWTWTILVANGGTAPANFANGQTILTDTLPGGATIMYGPAGTSNINGIVGTILCGITSGVLTCAASGAVAIAAPGSFRVSFTATVSAAGTYANPTGGSCAVDPNDNVPETNEGNNSCSNGVIVVGPPAITPPTLPPGTAGTGYAQSLTATGGAGGPYTFAVSTGALPAGLTLSPGGALGGTPTTPGTFSFTIAATDAAGNSGSQPYTLVVQAASLPITVLPTTLPGAVVGVAYAQMLTATGGRRRAVHVRGEYRRPASRPDPEPRGCARWDAHHRGRLPFTITAIDAAGTSGSQPYELAIAPPPITVLPATLPEPMVSVAYAHTLTATGGGGPPYIFAVTAGALPPGLVLSPEGRAERDAHHGRPLRVHGHRHGCDRCDRGARVFRRGGAPARGAHAALVGPAAPELPALSPRCVPVAKSNHVTCACSRGPWCPRANAHPCPARQNGSGRVVGDRPRDVDATWTFLRSAVSVASIDGAALLAVNALMMRPEPRGASLGG